MIDPFAQMLLRNSKVFAKASDTKKFGSSAVDHLFVKPDFVKCQLSAALFTARLRG